MRTKVRDDVILWTPDKPESLPRRWKCWQEVKSNCGPGFVPVPGTVAFWNQRPTTPELLRLPRAKGHRWVVGPV